MEFPILGRAFYADVSQPSLRQWLYEFWDYTSRFDHDPCNYKIELCHHAEPQGFPSDPATRQLALLNAQVDLYDQDPVFFLGDRQAGLRLELLERRAILDVWGEVAHVLSPLHMAMIEALRASALMPLHASVAVKNNQGLAFFGASGQGKTTTLLEAMGEGWQIICEDFAWLETETMQLYGWDRGLRLLPDTYQRFAAQLPTAAPVIAGKYFVPYDRLGGALGGTCRLMNWLLLKRNSSTVQTQLRSLSKRQAALKLWDATGISIAEKTRGWTAKQIPQVLHSCYYAELSLGTQAIPWTELTVERLH